MLFASRVQQVHFVMTCSSLIGYLVSKLFMGYSRPEILWNFQQTFEYHKSLNYCFLSNKSPPPSLNKCASYWPQFQIGMSPQIREPLPSPCFVEEYWDNQGCIVLVVFNHKQVIVNSFNHCTLTSTTAGSNDQLIHCLKPNQPCPAGLDRLIGLDYVVLQ